MLCQNYAHNKDVQAKVYSVFVRKLRPDFTPEQRATFDSNVAESGALIASDGAAVSIGRALCGIHAKQAKRTLPFSDIPTFGQNATQKALELYEAELVRSASANAEMARRHAEYMAERATQTFRVEREGDEWTLVNATTGQPAVRVSIEMDAGQVRITEGRYMNAGATDSLNQLDAMIALLT